MSIREKLQNEIHTDNWQVLRPHYRRGALILVSEDLDLVEAGVAVAEDQVEVIQAWLQSQKLSKPTSEQTADWDQNGAIFNCVIVQPYVLAKIQSA